MSRRRSRSRYSGPSYTARLQQRPASRPGRPASTSPRGGRMRGGPLGAAVARVGLRAAGDVAWPRAGWLTAGWPLAVAMLLAEAGHLAAAVVEWPGAAQRGAFHVVAAAVFGFAAVGGYFGASRPELGLGFGAGMGLPACWLAGALVGPSPYRDFSTLAAVGVTAVEVTAAALVAVHWRAGTSLTPPAVRGGEPAGDNRNLPQRARA